MENLNPSYIGIRKDLLVFVQGEDNLILDVGCATGTNGNYLLKTALASIVYGVEYDLEMARTAENFYDKVYCGDLNNALFREDITNCELKFDYILFGDVLEHLYDPRQVLADLKNLLTKDGKIIISLPNIAHIELFIQVYIKGTFPQNKRGIFDATHLRWFTKKDAEQLIKDSGLNMVAYHRNLRARDQIGSKFNWKYNVLKKINKNWFTFQHILICEHD